MTPPIATTNNTYLFGGSSYPTDSTNLNNTDRLNTLYDNFDKTVGKVSKGSDHFYSDDSFLYRSTGYNYDGLLDKIKTFTPTASSGFDIYNKPS
jgi:hypothetical protein